MKKWIKILFIILSISSLVWCQDLKKDYELLAKYSIIKYGVERANSIIDLPSFIEKQIHIIEKFIKNNNYLYDIEILFETDNYQIISIIDETNFQLHGLNFEIFAIDKKAEYLESKYYYLTYNNFIQFINNNLYKSNLDHHQLIQLFNTLKKYFYRYHTEIIFYDENNDEKFNYLKDIYIFYNLMKTEIDSDTTSYTNYYIKKLKLSGDLIYETEYYQIHYYFDSNKMRVEELLLYKTKP